MKKALIVDNRLRDCEKQYFLNNGYNLIEVPTSNSVYYEISSHVDIFCTKLGESIFVEPSFFNILCKSEMVDKKAINIICGKENIGYNYPEDIKYNVCVVGNNIIHNFKYTDSKILEYIKTNNLNMININQGYSKCSIAVIDDNSVIVTDKSIARILEKNGINVLCLNKDFDIKLYNKNGSYSNMKGFIGGAIARINEKIVIFGDLKNIDGDGKIREYITSRNLEIVNFKGQDVIDYGGMIVI